MIREKSSKKQSVEVKIQEKIPWFSKGSMAERGGFEDFSKSGNVEKSRKE